MVDGIFTEEAELRSLQLTIILLAALLTAGTPARAQQRPNLLDVYYTDERSHYQTLDVYLPARGEPPYPTIFAIHGGGYFFGSKLSLNRFASHFATAGYAVVVPNYRLAINATYPAPIADVVCALAWTHAHADEHGFNVERLVVVGESAGGNAAALLGTANTLEAYLDGCPYSAPDGDWMQGVVAYYPIVDLSTCDTSCLPARRAMALYLGVDEYTPEALGDASPLAGIDGDEPPFLVVHGTWDAVVPISEGELLADALEAASVPVKFERVRGAGHGFIDDLNTIAGRLSARAVSRWLDDLWPANQSS